MINFDRLLLEFKTLLTIESPSKKEGQLAYYLADHLEALGYKVFFDKSAEATGSEVGNLIIRIPGSVEGAPLLFCAHLDTVGPCEGVQFIEEDGIIKSDGKTILGADDKAGIAILIELAKILKENSFPHPPLEILFTTTEEIGLLGAKNLDYSHISASYGFVLDSENPEEVITGAPSSYQFTLKVYGKSAHAGIEPEKGINAIKILAHIITKLPTGRLDEETTMNLGKINGGNYVNIVPELAFVEGEMRSHKEEKLQALKEEIQKIAEEIISNYPYRVDNLPFFKLKFDRLFKAFQISKEDPLIPFLLEAGKRAGLNLTFKRKEGGSDANIFNERGIKTVILGTGMQKVHTKEEFIRVADLYRAAKLILEIVKLAGERPF